MPLSSPGREPEHYLFYAHHIGENDVVLSDQERHHAVAVLRFREGQEILVTDGQGARLRCALTAIGKDSCTAAIVERRFEPPPLLRLTCCVGLAGREAFERLLEDLPPLGVSAIVPLISDHCSAAWWRSWREHVPRFNKKLLTGLKQSLGFWLPQLCEPIPLPRVTLDPASAWFMASRSGLPLSEILANAPRSGSAGCIIGPPGGFTDAEETRLNEQGAQPVRLSSNRLTTGLSASLLCGGLLSSL
jgi:16S rRNA (uracil1498-N3)-methyltransferase